MDRARKGPTLVAELPYIGPAHEDEVEEERKRIEVVLLQDARWPMQDGK